MTSKSSDEIRSEIVTLARTYLGDKWKHQGRTHTGIDCVGLVITVGKELGLHDYPDDVPYRKLSLGADLIKPFERHCVRIRDLTNLVAGDILILRDTMFPQHVGLMTSPTRFIHATVHKGRVVEEPFTEDWKRKLITGFRYRCLDNG